MSFIDPVGAMYTHLVGVTAVTDVLGAFDDAPGVFEEIAPNGFEITDPIIIIDPPRNMPRDDTSTCTGRAIYMRLRVYGRVITENGATGYAALNEAAEVLAKALHNSFPTINGARTARVAVNGPHRAPTDTPSIGGRFISIRWDITEA